MITPAYIQTMAAYNAEMNRRIYAAAAKMTDAERKEDRRLFWGSLHATLNHLLWGDSMWMSRFAGWTKPTHPIKQSGTMHEDFTALTVARVQADAAISEWAKGVTRDWLGGDLVWHSGSMQREMRMPRDILVVHMFNHQTHHRGQAHAALTWFGHDPGATDMPFIL